MRRVVLLAVLLAGCASMDGPASGGANPFCRELGAWTQPGVFEALAALRDDPDASFEEPQPPAGLPFAAPRGQVLAGVRWDARGLHYGVQPDGADAANLTALVPGDATADEVRARFVLLARNVSTADDAQVEAWADAFVASRHPGLLSVDASGTESVQQWGHAVRVPAGVLALDRHAARLDAWAAPREDAGERAWTRGGEAWAFRFESPARMAVLHGAAEPVGVRATAAGEVRASDGGVGREASREDVRAAFAAQGLPTPTFEGWRAGHGIC